MPPSFHAWRVRWLELHGNFWNFPLLLGFVGVVPSSFSSLSCKESLFCASRGLKRRYCCRLSASLSCPSEMRARDAKYARSEASSCATLTGSLFFVDGASDGTRLPGASTPPTSTVSAVSVYLQDTSLPRFSPSRRVDVLERVI